DPTSGEPEEPRILDSTFTQARGRPLPAETGSLPSSAVWSWDRFEYLGTLFSAEKGGLPDTDRSRRRIRFSQCLGSRAARCRVRRGEHHRHSSGRAWSDGGQSGRVPQNAHCVLGRSWASSMTFDWLLPSTGATSTVT